MDGRWASPLTLEDAERKTLERLVRGQTTPQRMVRRASIVLRGADRLSIEAIAAELRTSRPTVSKWRARFRAHGLDGLADSPRSGRPRVVTGADVERVMKLTLETRRAMRPTGAPAQ